MNEETAKSRQEPYQNQAQHLGHSHQTESSNNTNTYSTHYSGLFYKDTLSMINKASRYGKHMDTKEAMESRKSKMQRELDSIYYNALEEQKNSSNNLNAPLPSGGKADQIRKNFRPQMMQMSSSIDTLANHQISQHKKNNSLPNSNSSINNSLNTHEFNKRVRILKNGPNSITRQDTSSNQHPTSSTNRLYQLPQNALPQVSSKEVILTDRPSEYTQSMTAPESEAEVFLITQQLSNVEIHQSKTLTLKQILNFNDSKVQKSLSKNKLNKERHSRGQGPTNKQEFVVPGTERQASNERNSITGLNREVYKPEFQKDGKSMLQVPTIKPKEFFKQKQELKGNLQAYKQKMNTQFVDLTSRTNKAPQDNNMTHRLTNHNQSTLTVYSQDMAQSHRERELQLRHTHSNNNSISILENNPYGLTDRRLATDETGSARRHTNSFSTSSSNFEAGQTNLLSSYLPQVNTAYSNENFRTRIRSVPSLQKYFENRQNLEKINYVEPRDIIRENKEQPIESFVNMKRHSQTQIDTNEHSKASIKLWESQFNQLIRKTNLINGQNEMRSSSQSCLPRCDSHSSSMLAIQEDWGVPSQSMFRRDYGKKVPKGEQYGALGKQLIEEQINEELSRKLPKTLMKSTPALVQREMHVKKMENRMNEISGAVIESFRSELEKDYAKPLDDHEYLKHLIHELGLKDSDQLASLAAERISQDKQENTKKNQQLNQLRMLDARTSTESDTLLNKTKSSLRHLSQGAQRTTHCTTHGHRLKENQDTSNTRDSLLLENEFMLSKKSNFRQLKQKWTKLMNFKVHKKVEAKKMEDLGLFLKKRTSQLMEEQAQMNEQKQYMKYIHGYQSQLNDEAGMKQKEVEETKRVKAELRNPGLAENFEQLVEENMDEIMRASNAFRNVHVGFKKRAEMNEVKQQARNLTAGIKQKAKKQEVIAKIRQSEAQRTNSNASSKDSKSHRTQYLVQRFADKLKQQMFEGKDEATIKQNEIFIKNLLKTTSYNMQFKAANPRIIDAQKQASTLNKKGQHKVSKSATGKAGAGAEAQALEEAKKAEVKAVDAADADGHCSHSQSAESGKSASSEEEAARTEKHSSCSSAFDSDEQYEQGQYTDENVGKKIINQYIRGALEKGDQPLPILKKVTQSGQLCLVNYIINEANSSSFASTVHKIIPSVLKKLYMINNSINDHQIHKILFSLGKSEGLQTLAIIQNQLGPSAYESLSGHLVPTKAFRSIKKFILKDPIPHKFWHQPLLDFSYSLLKVSSKLTSLHKLSLSKLGFNQEIAQTLAKAVVKMPNLYSLDISGNDMDADTLGQFLMHIGKKNAFRQFNISYNNKKSKTEAFNENNQGQGKSLENKASKSPKKKTDKNKSPKKKGSKAPVNADEDALELHEIIANFLHHSESLLHFDMSGIDMPTEGYFHIAKRGIRKSRTLLAIHMCGMPINQDQLQELRQCLNIKQTLSAQTFNDPNIENRFEFAKMHVLQFKKVFSQELQANQQQLFTQNLEKNEQNQKLKAQNVIKSPIYKEAAGQRIVFQRILGHGEVLNSHRWVEAHDANCCICNKQTYCIVIWNKRLSAANLQKECYKRSNVQPIKLNFKSYAHPILGTKDSCYPMIPLLEFMERQKMNGASAKVRACDDEIESQKHNKLFSQVFDQIDNQKLDLTYWSYQKAVLQASGRKSWSATFTKISNHSETTAVMQNWGSKLIKMIPFLAHQVVDIKDYEKRLQQLYPQESATRLEDMAADTYVWAMYLPDNINDHTNSLDIVVKHPRLQGVEYVRSKVPRQKHLSINKMAINQKQIKKVKEIRQFVKAQSVFAEYQEDTVPVLDKSFRTDWALMKIPKFVKDVDEREKIFAVLWKYYSPLKDQFTTQIGTPAKYPVIGWLDFANTCQEWGILDKKLTQQDVDRIFIATNFEEEDVTGNNDDKNLCRFEYFEIIVRMAKHKYCDQGICKTIPEAAEKIISEFLLPNFKEEMGVQQFRNDQLWTLEVDELYKKNMKGLEALYKRFATNKQLKPPGVFMARADCLEMMKVGSEQVLDGLNTEVLENKVKQVVMSYSLSKVTIKDEMQEYDEYNKMSFVEFLEFLARFADFLYEIEQIASFPKKLAKLFAILFPVVGQKFVPSNTDADIESDSDYDDDIIDHIIQEKLSLKNQ